MFSYITEWYGALVLYVTKWNPIFLFPVLVVCCDVYPSLGMNCMQELGVEEAQNWLDKPSEERNVTKISRGYG